MVETVREVKEFREVSSHTDLPQEYLDGLSRCVQSAFGGGVTEEDALSHMHGDQVLIGFDRNDDDQLEIVGFSATKLKFEHTDGEDFSIPKPYAYFAAAAIAKSHQRTGLYAHLNDIRMDYVLENGIDRVATRTQNPRVEEGISAALDRMVEARRIRSYVISRQVIQGVYGGMLTDVRPVARVVNYDNIDYERGDANLIDWQLFS